MGLIAQILAEVHHHLTVPALLVPKNNRPGGITGHGELGALVILTPGRWAFSSKLVSHSLTCSGVLSLVSQPLVPSLLYRSDSPAEACYLS